MSSKLPSGLKRNSVPNKFDYPRDLLLNVFGSDYTMAEDTDHSLLCFVDEPRPPLAHLPLSDIEKKLLTMLSINSDMGRRGYPAARPKKKTKEVKGDDVWDMPTTSKPVLVLEELSEPVLQKNAWSVLADDPIQSLPKPNIQTPDFIFVPPMWVYEDPGRQVQGPFTSQQMHGWYSEGYFPPGLPIKCEGDPDYIQLASFIKMFGQDSPFLVSLREQEQLEKQSYYEQYLQPSFLQRPVGFPSYNSNYQSSIQGSTLYSNPIATRQPTERSFERPIERPVERSTERPIERTTERPIERVIDRPIERVIERPVERFTERPVIERAIERPVIERAIERPVIERAIERPVVERAIERPIERVHVAAERVVDLERLVEQIKLEPSEKQKAFLSFMQQKQVLEEEEVKSARIAKAVLKKEVKKEVRKEETFDSTKIPKEKQQWGSVKKEGRSLADIMNDESKRAKPAEASKGYAQSIGKEEQWNTVGLVKQKPAAPAAPAQKPKLNYANSTKEVVNQQGEPQKQGGPKFQVSTTFQSWYKKALQPAVRESLIVDDFMSILLSMNLKEQATITMICDDALGGVMDSRKFADEFIKRRRAELEGVPYQSTAATTGLGVTPTPKVSQSQSQGSNGGFTEVKKKKGKKVQN